MQVKYISTSFLISVFQRVILFLEMEKKESHEKTHLDKRVEIKLPAPLL